MKIRRIHTQVAIMSKEHKFSFDISQHKLEYFPELSMFKIDETLVPISNIREVLLVEEDQRTTHSGVAALDSGPLPDIAHPARKSKRNKETV